MLAFASVGLIANIIGALVLRPGSRESLNVKGAYLEVLGGQGRWSLAAFVGTDRCSRCRMRVGLRDCLVGQGCTELVGVRDRHHLAAGVLLEPGLGILGGGDVAHLVAERRTDGGHGPWVDQLHHRGGGFNGGDTGRLDGDPYRLAAGR